MSNILELNSSVLEQIGNTSLLQLHSIVPKDHARILIKLESENPPGSMKDRMALALVTQVVIDIEPWFLPRYMVPLAGMVFSGAMNAVSLAAERLESELARSVEFTEARATALNAALIPMINSLFAVGLVSLPGMMTGQILSGVSPVVAAKYQIVVMCMFFSAAGMSSTIYLALARQKN